MRIFFNFIPPLLLASVMDITVGYIYNFGTLQKPEESTLTTNLCAVRHTKS
jgi:hypothetical protein